MSRKVAKSSIKAQGKGRDFLEQAWTQVERISQHHVQVNPDYVPASGQPDGKGERKRGKQKMHQNKYAPLSNQQ